MFHPLINAASLNDDELLRRIQKSQEVLSYAISVGNNSLFHSAEQALLTYRQEFETRLQKKRDAEEKEKNPDGIIEIGTIEDISNKKTYD